MFWFDFRGVLNFTFHQSFIWFEKLFICFWFHTVWIDLGGVLVCFYFSSKLCLIWEVFFCLLIKGTFSPGFLVTFAFTFLDGLIFLGRGSFLDGSPFQQYYLFLIKGTFSPGFLVTFAFTFLDGLIFLGRGSFLDGSPFQQYYLFLIKGTFSPGFLVTFNWKDTSSSDCLNVCWSYTHTFKCSHIRVCFSQLYL